MISREEFESEQKKLEASADINERRRYGQFFTPVDLAKEIAAYGLSLSDDDIHYLEPAFGMGAFCYAVESLAGERMADAVGVEQDEHIFESTKAIWEDSKIDLRCADFTALPAGDDKKTCLS